MVICHDKECGNYSSGFKNHCRTYNAISKNKPCEARMSKEKARRIDRQHQVMRQKKELGLIG